MPATFENGGDKLLSHNYEILRQSVGRSTEES